MRIADLVLDPSIYPRAQVDLPHVSRLIDAIEAGHALPSITVERRTSRVIDGWHRLHAHKKLYGENADIRVDLQDYPDEAAAFLAAVRANSQHGRTYSAYDRTRCLARLAALGVQPQLAADALGLSVQKADRLTIKRTAHVGDAMVAVKQSTQHLAGTTITERQHEGIKRAGGNNFTFYAGQLASALEHDLVDRRNANLRAHLERLYGLLADHLAEPD